MNPFVFDSTTSKAITGGLVGLLVALGSRYGLHAGPETLNILNVLVTAAVGYVIGHVAVYFAPANKVN